VLLRLGHYLLAALLNALVDHIVGALTVELKLAVLAQYHRHPLPHVVEVQDAEELVDLALAHDVDGDAVRRALLEDEAEVAGRGYEGRLVRRLGLVLQVSRLVLGHHRVAQRQQPEEAVHVLVVALHRVQQTRVVELEFRLVVFVEGEVQRRHRLFTFLSFSLSLSLSLSPSPSLSLSPSPSLSFSFIFARVNAGIF
jgi:hypothetical protein